MVSFFTPVPCVAVHGSDNSSLIGYVCALSIIQSNTGTLFSCLVPWSGPILCFRCALVNMFGLYAAFFVLFSENEQKATVFHSIREKSDQVVYGGKYQFGSTVQVQKVSTTGGPRRIASQYAAIRRKLRLGPDSSVFELEWRLRS